MLSQHALQEVSQHALQQASRGVYYPSMHCRRYPTMPCSRSLGGCAWSGGPALGGGLLVWWPSGSKWPSGLVPSGFVAFWLKMVFRFKVAFWYGLLGRGPEGYNTRPPHQKVTTPEGDHTRRRPHQKATTPEGLTRRP